MKMPDVDWGLVGTLAAIWCAFMFLALLLLAGYMTWQEEKARRGLKRRERRK